MLTLCQLMTQTSHYIARSGVMQKAVVQADVSLDYLLTLRYSGDCLYLLNSASQSAYEETRA